MATAATTAETTARLAGDWDCEACGAVVFASKKKCFRCSAPQPTAPKLQLQGDYNYEPTAAAAQWASMERQPQVQPPKQHLQPREEKLAAAEVEAKRVDSSDGRWYSREEFLAEYGNLLKWENSAPPTASREREESGASGHGSGGGSALRVNAEASKRVVAHALGQKRQQQLGSLSSAARGGGVAVSTEKQQAKGVPAPSFPEFGDADKQQTRVVRGSGDTGASRGSKVAQGGASKGKEGDTSQGSLSAAQACPTASWPCPSCTFANISFLPTCEMCGSSRPTSAHTKPPPVPPAAAAPGREGSGEFSGGYGGAVDKKQQGRNGKKKFKGSTFLMSGGRGTGTKGDGELEQG